MTINIQYIDHIATERRKMRTTRGPGYTTLKVSLKASVPESEMPPAPWPSLTTACESGLMPESITSLNPDRTSLGWGYWYTGEKGEVCTGFTFWITFEDRGHAKRAEAALKALGRSRSAGVEAAFLRSMIEQVFASSMSEREREESKRQLSWMASGIVAEARRKAKQDMRYEEAVTALRNALRNHTENNAIDLVSQVSREHGVDEADLKLAVEAVLAEPPTFIGRY